VEERVDGRPLLTAETRTKAVENGVEPPYSISVDRWWLIVDS